MRIITYCLVNAVLYYLSLKVDRSVVQHTEFVEGTYSCQFSSSAKKEEDIFVAIFLNCKWMIHFFYFLSYTGFHFSFVHFWNFLNPWQEMKIQQQRLFSVRIDFLVEIVKQKLNCLFLKEIHLIGSFTSLPIKKDFSFYCLFVYKGVWIFGWCDIIHRATQREPAWWCRLFWW